MVVFAVIFLISCELLLRSIAFFTQTKNEIQSDKYPILTLGESTTARNKKPVDWPAQLEAQLNKENIPAVVYNEARFATTTSAILENTPYYLQKYKPKLIITMMGINDYHLIWPKHFVLTDKKNPLTYFKTYKFFKYLTASSKLKEPEELRGVISSDLEYPKHGQILKKLSEASRQSKEYQNVLEEVEAFLKNKPDGEKALYYKHLSEKLPQSPLNKNSDLMKNLDFVMKALRMIPGPADGTASWALHLAISTHQYHLCKEIIDFAKRDRSKMEETFLLRVATCLKDEPDYVKEVFVHAGDNFEFRGTALETPVKTNYIRLAELIEDTDICWIAMGYPRRPASEGMLAVSESGDEKIFVLLNQNNFEDALKTHTFDEVFEDKFAIDFGHSTFYGNSLIASNVFEFIKKLKSKKLCGL
jgi:lysophospholipase L1-like esterase